MSDTAAPAFVRELYLLRHCKSSWAEAGAADFDRRLAPRGKRDAEAIGEALKREEPPPDAVICSSAQRALGTARRVAEGWGAPEPSTDRRLYDGGIDGWLAVLHTLDDSFRRVMLVGHNPTIEHMVSLLGAGSVAMGTGTLVKIALALPSWLDLSIPAGGTILRIWERPER